MVKMNDKNIRQGAREMAQQLQELAALQEDLGLVPSFTTAPNPSFRGLSALFWPLKACHTQWCT